MTNLVRFFAVAGVAGFALSGCGAAPDAEPVAEESAVVAKFPVKMPLPRPTPTPLPLPGGGVLWDPPVYPDYGMETMGACDPGPTPIDLENWGGSYSLWGSHSGSIMPYWTYNTADRLVGDINYHRMELFGIDTTTNTVIWHAFGPPDPVTGKIPQALLNMAGTEDPYCAISHIGTGSFSSGKPPKDPPRPPDGTLGGRIMFCPTMVAVYDLSQRLAGCSDIVQ